MPYHVTILRTQGDQALPIFSGEVIEAVGRMGGRLAVMPGNPALWLVRPELGQDSEIVVCGDGQCWAADPSEALLALMIELAGYLGARVRGDEYETYRSPSEVHIHPDDGAVRDEYYAPPAAIARPPRARGLRLAGVAAAIVVLSSVVTLCRYLVKRR